MKAKIIKLTAIVIALGTSTTALAAGACCVVGAVCCMGMPCCP